MWRRAKLFHSKLGEEVMILPACPPRFVFLPCIPLTVQTQDWGKTSFYQGLQHDASKSRRLQQKTRIQL